jgi:hypothetical protein
MGGREMIIGTALGNDVSYEVAMGMNIVKSSTNGMPPAAAPPRVRHLFKVV